MALFGTFADVSFPDVISLIGSSSGIFTIRQVNYELPEIYELTMENGHITRMSFNAQEIFSSAQAQSFLTELMRNNNGEFEFHREPVMKGSLSIHITEALLSSVSQLDEMKALRDQFADPQTVFVHSEKNHLYLSPDQREFWLGIEDYFRKGICAVDLSEKLGLFLDQIQLKLYKLQLANVIAPKRAYYKTEPLPTVKAMKLLEKNLDAELQSLVQSLEPIWARPKTEPIPFAQKKIAPEAEVRRAIAPVVEHPAEKLPGSLERHDFSSVQIYRPQKKMVGNFMSSLKKLMRAG